MQWQFGTRKLGLGPCPCVGSGSSPESWDLLLQSREVSRASCAEGRIPESDLGSNASSATGCCYKICGIIRTCKGGILMLIWNLGRNQIRESWSSISGGTSEVLVHQFSVFRGALGTRGQGHPCERGERRGRGEWLGPSSASHNHPASFSWPKQPHCCLFKIHIWNSIQYFSF